MDLGNVSLSLSFFWNFDLLKKYSCQTAFQTLPCSQVKCVHMESGRYGKEWWPGFNRRHILLVDTTGPWWLVFLLWLSSGCRNWYLQIHRSFASQFRGVSLPLGPGKWWFPLNWILSLTNLHTVSLPCMVFLQTVWLGFLKYCTRYRMVGSDFFFFLISGADRTLTPPGWKLNKFFCELTKH